VRIVFLGTPQFAVPALRAIHSLSFDLAAVFSRPDRPAGRGRSATAPPVKELASSLGVPVFQPENPNAEEPLERLRSLAPDCLVVVAYGAILSPPLLAVARLGALNLHASLLPHYRGASPVAQAILDGVAGTGVTTMWMDKGIDTGDVVYQRYVSILPEESAGALSARLATIGADLLVETLHAIERGDAPRHRQDRAAGRYCRKLRKEQGIIDWALGPEALARHVRAMTPWPGAQTAFVDGGAAGAHVLIVEEARVLDEIGRDAVPGTVLPPAAVGPTAGVPVACTGGSVELLRVRPAGKHSMNAADWWRGVRAPHGRFSGAELP
jgi:methionyl-tRNA formyltransferase